ncbi:MAG TPA: hypothetical protein VMT64_08090, partial [Candidatus Binataceae bacterium]|nr:hypothetical protein [Candidatus Binataceae bacterium]
GRFLEHGRIYYFHNGGNDEYYIGSADLMKRNLESRVEVITPVEDPALRKELRMVLDCQLAPNECAWEMQSDGSYVRCTESESNCQEFLMGYVDQQLKEAAKRKRRKNKGFARRAARAIGREAES